VRREQVDQVLLVRQVLEVLLVPCLDQRRPQLATSQVACLAARVKEVPVVAAVADAEDRSVQETTRPTSSAATATCTR
jgi:hypothetical protein